MDALVELIDEEPGIEFVEAARSDAEAIALALTHKPDVFLVDLEATEVNAAWIAREITQHLPGSRLVGLSACIGATRVRQAIDAGFHRHVNKSSDLADLMTVLLEDHVHLS